MTAFGHLPSTYRCQPDGMYLTARATWFTAATDPLTTAKYEYALSRDGYCSASIA
ncbi:MAG: hypothetical protein NT028_13715 [candidate division Zixibacteria bacterium]|nr:hypothetical protein [candidate division Zixibacteria bacterium]